ncbi:MAG: alpha-galactosidase [Lachnospiraceae bacterium]|nr:alpha-galactosidase [Lachnospiraceae bacterium]
MKNNYLRKKTPIMGWASWNCFGTNINEKILKEQAAALVTTGLAECGYNYFNIDDGFFGGRGDNGRILIHRERFPNGIKVLADYVHSLGLKAGIYAEGGDNTCGFLEKEGANGKNVGLYGYEEQDIRMYLEEFEFDYIKVDWCGGLRLGLDEREQYTKIGNIIDQIREETGRIIVYNVCRWQFPGEWVAEVADSWRTGGDIQPQFSSILHQIDNVKSLAYYCGPGHVNDLDMMQIGNGLSEEEEKTHFSMWCMMSSPLIIGCNLTTISEKALEILKNKEMISINQDEACQQAFLTKQVFNGKEELIGEIWLKNLGMQHSRKKAVAFLNRGEETLVIRASIEELGLAGDIISVRDVWSHQEIKLAQEFQVTVPPHGVVIYVVEASACGIERNLYEVENNWLKNIQEKNTLTDEEVRGLLKEGALLIDVREPQEYEEAHLPQAINLSYTGIHVNARVYLPDKEQTIIVYCKTGKRCGQAKQSLTYLGYKNVYDWKVEVIGNDEV